MKYRLVFTKQYEKRARRFLKLHPELEPAYLKTLKLLQANPFHPSLRLHRLTGRLSGLHSISITLSYRITMEFLVVDEQITPVNIGDHDTVY
ncbi:type II toxin-antitoxin system RelE/ParE family toxin [Geomonas azotofigens]|uniref:type II toxin-antitoxin system RelE/ParE family toxin n=1 Tax=Geomonas azotofigens TaxID=2843196 RepID=UPI001C1022B4|nr:plasmid stabilization protein [Geomonas azotofigens]MBU5613591.1 plasmid stabilization protein [Geomonas azotofigens]